MPNRLTARPSELTISSCIMSPITGGSRMRWIASNTIKMLIRIRNRPLAKPDSVSTRVYPNGKRSSVGHNAITLAARPIKMAAQSKNMWIASLISPSELVHTPHTSWTPMNARLRHRNWKMRRESGFARIPDTMPRSCANVATVYMTASVSIVASVPGGMDAASFEPDWYECVRYHDVKYTGE